MISAKPRLHGFDETNSSIKDALLIAEKELEDFEKFGVVDKVSIGHGTISTKYVLKTDGQA